MSKRSSKNFVPDPVEMLAVYLPNANGRSTRCISFLMPRGKAGFEAFDADDRSLGVFANQKLAADALTNNRPSLRSVGRSDKGEGQ